MAEFDDLDALAAQGADGKTLFRVGGVWSYPGAPRPDGNASNMRLPLPNATHARVKAALDTGAWFACRLDLDGSPRAVMKSDPDGKPIKPLGPQAFGAVEKAG